MFWLLTLLLASASGSTPDGSAARLPATVSAKPIDVATMLSHESRRIRTDNKRVMALMQDGVRRSRTFADLVSKIHQTNVIVYLEPSFALPPDMSGRILLQTVAGKQRYLRMQVRATLQGDQLIAVIAHELRHALEVADDPAVVDDAGLIALYRRIGHASHGAKGYDTEEARVIGRIVREELTG